MLCLSIALLHHALSVNWAQFPRKIIIKPVEIGAGHFYIQENYEQLMLGSYEVYIYIYFIIKIKKSDFPI